MIRQAIFWLIGVLALAPSCLADPSIERVWPPVLQRGQTTRVELSGTDLDHPLGVWTSVPGINVIGTPTGTPTSETVTIDIAVPANAPLGLYGLRLATASGLSNVHLFLLDELSPALQVRSATDEEADAARPLSLPVCCVSPVRRARVDRYAIDVVADQRVTFEVIGNRLGKNFDPVVTLRDERGKFIAQCDNSVGLMFDCRFSHTFPTAGRFTVEVADARFAGEPSWSYILRIGDFPVVQTAVPSAIQADQETELTFPQLPGLVVAAGPQSESRKENFFFELRSAPGKPATWIPLAVTNRPVIVEREPNNLPEHALTVSSPLALSAEICGILSEPGDEDWFQFPLAKGQSLRLRSFTHAIGSAADLEMILYEPTNEPGGREVARNDETAVVDSPRNTRFVEEANLTFSARTAGLHRLLIRDLTGAGSPAHTYWVEVSENLPDLKLKSDISEIVLPRGTWQPVPLKITRTGFTGPVELELVGAPAGVTLEPSTIPADAEEFVCRLSSGPDVLECVATLQIICRAQGNDRLLETVTQVHPLVDRQTANKDRILTALRADQRDLPPSLTTRIALQVTAPAPFDFDLPEQAVMMPKYQIAQLPIETRRVAGFSSPISFTARGGQLGDEREERVQVYFNAPAATIDRSSIAATIANRILTQYQKHRVDVIATADVDGRQVSLMRTFQLDIRAAYEPKFEPATIEAKAGETVKVKITANRVPTFDGELTLDIQNSRGVLTAPDNLVIPRGQAELPLEFIVKADTNPGRYELRYESTAYVGKFQELIRAPVLVINVKKPEPGK
jgi:hypothetical protein